MSSLDNASKGLIAAASIAGIGFVGYTMYSCYKKEGSISMSGLSKCFIVGGANVIADLGKGALSGAWSLTRKGGKELWKLTKKGGHEFKDNVINPAGKWSKKAAKDTEKWITKAPTSVINSTEKGLKKMFSTKNVKKSFSKKNIKKTFKHLF
jgi:hypothetical protein